MSRKVKRPLGIVGKDERYENSKFWLMYGVDLEKRRISIHGDIDEDSVSYAIRGINKMLEVDPEAAIDVYINSYGGDAYEALALYDAISDCTCNVRTHGQGKVMSAGLMIYLAGDERYSFPNTTFMAHTALSRTGGKSFEQEVDLLELKRIDSIICQMLSEKTKKSKMWWARKIKTHDYYIPYKEALELGIVTQEYQEVEVD